jgi:hypothetical protein
MEKNSMKVFVGTKEQKDVKKVAFAYELSRGHAAGKVFLTAEGQKVLRGWKTGAN